MIENLLPIKVPAGILANGTSYQAKGRWRSSNLVRFHEGKIQPIGGWLQRSLSGDTIEGTPNALVSWQTAAGVPLMVLGTTSALYAIDENDEVFDITPSPAPNEETDNDILWQLTIFGSFVIATASLQSGDDFVQNVYTWMGVTASPATAAWSDADGPIGAFATFATPERFLVVLRGDDGSDFVARTGVDTGYSERRLYWASQETIDDFIPSDVNEAGDFDLTTDGELMQGLASRGQSLIWTTTDLWTMNFIGDQLVYGFQNVGRACGTVSKQAACVLDSGAYWMGRERFHHFDGFVRPIPCEVSDAVFGNFNRSLYRLVWVLPNAPFNEVTWFYPSLGSTRCDRYVTYNYVEKHWVIGGLIRHIGIGEQFGQQTPNPVMFNGSVLYDHETGDVRGGGQAALESGPIELGDGDRLMRVQGIVPDDNSIGDVQFWIYTRMYPDGEETAHGPYTPAALTLVRWTARQIRIRIEEALPSDWRIGVIRLAVLPAERRSPSTSGALPNLTPFSIEITPEEISLEPDQQVVYVAVVKNSDGVALSHPVDGWDSDNDSKATVNSEGVATAHDDTGTATITAFITDPPVTSNEAIIDLVADPVPFSITVTPDPTTIEEGDTVQLVAVVKNAANVVLAGYPIDSWVSDDTDTATVDSDGLVTGVLAGTCGVTAHITSPAIVSNTADVTVEEVEYIIHTFVPFTDNFVVTAGSGNVEVLLVAGGGSGGSVDGTGVGCGGGGGGGVLHIPAFAVSTGTYPVTVGAGGTAPHANHFIGVGALDGNSGDDSTFGGSTAYGGGGGGGFNVNGRQGKDGGSGGGGGSSDGAGHAGGAGVSMQGHDGGDGVSSTGALGAGGGGAGADGGIGSMQTGGAGAAYGTASLTNSLTTYGAGGDSVNSAGADATDGTGNGGQGGSQGTNRDGGDGGDGRVFIRYRVSSGITATGGTIVP